MKKAAPTEAAIVPYEADDMHAYKKAVDGHTKKVLVGGCFDLLHIGHIRFLKQAKKTGDFLIVVLESDEFIRTSKHRSPVHSQAMRAEVLASNRYVDLVVTLPYLKRHQDYDLMVASLAPDVIAITAGDSGQVHKVRQAKALGIELIEVTPLITDYSSSTIIHEIISRD